MLLNKSITYTDYNGNQRTEQFSFNLNKAELLELDSKYPSIGLNGEVSRISKLGNPGAFAPLFKEIITMAYGEKTDDGRRFVKSKELSDSFVQTAAYDVLFMELASTEDSMENFLQAIMPKDISLAIQKQIEDDKSGSPIEFSTVSK